MADFFSPVTLHVLVQPSLADRLSIDRQRLVLSKWHEFDRNDNDNDTVPMTLSHSANKKKSYTIVFLLIENFCHDPMMHPLSSNETTSLLPCRHCCVEFYGNTIAARVTAPHLASTHDENSLQSP
jgi:hypothetical protein